MARRPNYGAEKRQKEIQRQKKKEDKAEKKRLRKEAGLSGPEEAGADDLEGLGFVAADDDSDEDGEDGEDGDEREA